ncbi:MAG: flavodoxin family protein [Methanosarcinales archaeon]|nr:flavodoxin family protein [Methanosarcinales archaeon]
MRVLALVGSPRVDGNTDMLVEELLQGARASNHDCQKLYLYHYDILPCLDCRRCKQGSFVCSLKDEMDELYPLLEAADLIVFGTPVYWYGPTGKMKLFIDRLRPFIASKRLKGKAGLLVSPSEEGAEGCRPLVEMFRSSLDYLEMEFAGSLLAKAYEKGEVAASHDDMQRAYRLGTVLQSLL